MTDSGKANIATEQAFKALLDGAVNLKLPIDRPMGLMYLPTAELTRNFQLACRAILAALATK